MILSQNLPPNEGIGSYVWNLSQYLIRMDHKVLIVTRGGVGPTTYEKLSGIKILRPTFLPTYPLHVHLHGLFVKKAVHSLGRNIDLLHIHSPLSPPIHSEHPVAATIHSTMLKDTRLTPLNSYYSLLMKLQGPFSVHLENELLRSADYVSAVSPEVVESLRAYPACPSDVEVTWNGVDSDFFQPPTDDEQGEPNILTVSRLAPGKGLEDLLEAAAIVRKKYQKIKFIIAGKGPLESTLKRTIIRREMESFVKLLGHVSDSSQIRKLYQRAAIFVLPSHHEGLPTVVLEAMACARPVIATRVGGIPYIINHGENGYIVASKAPGEMADAIIQFLGASTHRAEIGRQARKTVEKRFSWQKIGHHYVSKYRELVG